VRTELIDILRCPASGQPLSIEGSVNPEVEIESGWLVSADGKHRYAIRNGIPRFVPEDNYAGNFGMQWNLFRRTQLDSASGHPISADRFWAATGWRPEQLEGKWVLDIGCGAGRFAEVALQSGAKVVAIDYSSAVDACHESLAGGGELHLIQGDVYTLPLRPAAFSFVYSLGVLQHTPDVERAFHALPPALEPGGRLCVDYYEKSWRSALLPKYWLRPLTKHLPHEVLLRILKVTVPALLPVSRLVGAIPVLGRSLQRLLPVACYYGSLPLDDQQQKEWALLDTFDWLSPGFDNPQTEATVTAWIQKAGLHEIEVLRAGHLVTRGRR
jgi:2-polyprenyl-3-methyl-5-hydroxy-6-metoxy-1,4-benzoquinol methylase